MLDYFKIYFTVVSVLLSSVGAINLTIDPLWYFRGNKLKNFNMSFNERLTKTNLFLHSNRQKYDCLIFGSSRLTLLNTTSLKNNVCFNYSFSAAKSEEFAKYAAYAKEKGVNPKKVYVGIDAFNFTPSKKTAFQSKVEVAEPKPIYQSYLLSLDTLRFSFKTITGQFSEVRFYDQGFQGRVSKNAPQYKPKFSNKRSQEKCDFSRIPYYKQIRQIFPNAEIIGYVPPISAWKVFNDSYARGLLDCQLEGIYQVAKNFDTTYDFSYPSKLTTRTDNTYDGSHYYPDVHDQIAKVLEGKRTNLGIRANQYSLNEYQQFHKNKLKEFLQKQGEGSRW
ncbi:hypothetical protein I8751_20030 [Nostocaceae cyanobacterium CENA357]|uniref:Uncharacterized protein n=1 Tax=Atlanticothrix silvestris CENA357 TaxID=1725252 RepID=A0A8J7HH77_9CYAN|nr:hypothetical protein [Atlanticothrix silvestris]MBH8554608.1 hypothetical protein [Atlanticothrix silvestris CENA357]